MQITQTYFHIWQKPNTPKNEVQKLNQTQIIHTHCILFIHSDRVLRPTCHLLGTLKHQLWRLGVILLSGNKAYGIQIVKSQSRHN
jgi:hypothetical protein